MSTGLSTLSDVRAAALCLRPDRDVLLHCVGAYPAQIDDLRIDTIGTLRRYGISVGYSGHEVGIATSVVAAALSACVVERHVTLDRAQHGSDHAASLEPTGLHRLVRDIRAAERARGERPSWPMSCELDTIKRLS